MFSTDTFLLFTFSSTAYWSHMFRKLILLISSGKMGGTSCDGSIGMTWSWSQDHSCPASLSVVFEYWLQILVEIKQNQISDYKDQHTWRSIRVEDTLGHTREYGNHRICAILWVCVWKFNNLCSIIQESVSQKLVHKENIPNLLTWICKLSLIP